MSVIVTSLQTKSACEVSHSTVGRRNWVEAGFHAELNTVSPDAAMIRKGRSYARGFGYVLSVMTMVRGSWHSGFRPIVGAVLSLGRVTFAQARYYANVALGRVERFDTSSYAGASFRLDKLDEKPIANVEGEIRLFIAMRNELSRLPYFLSYYRAMGVGRFFFVDDRSDDGSREFILAQNDCHVFQPTNSYRESKFGLDWVNALSDEYGIGHWILTIDADELLVYPHCETVKLPDFCRYLEMTGSSAFFAFLLDMYPSENLSEAKCIPGKPFHEICPYFDKDYVFKKMPEHDSETSVLPPIRVIGGPRLRKFYAWQTRTDILSRAAFAAVESIARRLPFWLKDKPHYAPALTKVPLIKWHKGCRRITAHLAVKPQQGQLSTVTGALLHFKFFADFHDKAKKELSRKQHYDGAQEYRRYLSHVRRKPDISFIYGGTRRFADSNTLVQIGLIQSDPELEAYLQEGSVAKTPMRAVGPHSSRRQA